MKGKKMESMESMEGKNMGNMESMEGRNMGNESRKQETSNIERSNLERYAEQELRMAGLFDDDSDYGGMLATAVMELVKVFSSQGHSGFSANIVMNLFNKVARFEPIQPLTGADDEWIECGSGVFQNKRCSHVFKDSKDGPAHDIKGKVFRTPNGACYTNSDSRVFIKFPYVPKTEYVNVEE